MTWKSVGWLSSDSKIYFAWVGKVLNDCCEWFGSAINKDIKSYFYVENSNCKIEILLHFCNNKNLELNNEACEFFWHIAH